jgi:lipopolysaccharide heptosyltransferase I
VNILIVKMSALGDVTHTLPALTTLRRHHPAAHIAWLVEEIAVDIIQGHQALDRVIVWRRRKWQQLAKSGRLLTLARAVSAFLRELRDTRYDLIIDFQALLKSALWVSLARGVRKAGYGPGMRHAEGSWIVLNERVPAVPNEKHAIDRYLLLLEGLGMPRLPLAYDFPFSPETEREAGSLLSAAGLPAGTAFVAANPMSRWPTKNWTTDHFAQLADSVVAHGLQLVWTGGPADRAAIDSICGSMQSKAVRVDGRTSLKTLAAIYRRARVVVSTDTGPMHIAAAVGTPVVALFGPTSPESTGPYGEGHSVLRVGLDCSPCFKKTCKTRQYEKHACMLRLKVAEVSHAVLRQAAQRDLLAAAQQS